MKPVEGFPGYFVTSDGIVISTKKHNGSEYREMKPRINNCGYKRVLLRGPDGGKEKLVHRLVLETFVGPCPDGYETRHLDGDPSNNHLANLAWGTKAENGRDAASHGKNAFPYVLRKLESRGRPS